MESGTADNLLLSTFSPRSSTAATADAALLLLPDIVVDPLLINDAINGDRHAGRQQQPNKVGMSLKAACLGVTALLIMAIDLWICRGTSTGRVADTSIQELPEDGPLLTMVDQPLRQDLLSPVVRRLQETSSASPLLSFFMAAKSGPKDAAAGRRSSSPSTHVVSDMEASELSGFLAAYEAEHGRPKLAPTPHEPTDRPAARDGPQSELSDFLEAYDRSGLGVGQEESSDEDVAKLLRAFEDSRLGQLGVETRRRPGRSDVRMGELTGMGRIRAETPIPKKRVTVGGRVGENSDINGEYKLVERTPGPAGGRRDTVLGYYVKKPEGGNGGSEAVLYMFYMPASSGATGIQQQIGGRRGAWCIGEVVHKNERVRAFVRDNAVAPELIKGTWTLFEHAGRHDDDVVTIQDPRVQLSTASCMNRVKDGNEEDVDCGGSCRPCGSFSSCAIKRPPPPSYTHGSCPMRGTVPHGEVCEYKCPIGFRPKGQVHAECYDGILVRVSRGAECEAVYDTSKPPCDFIEVTGSPNLAGSDGGPLVTCNGVFVRHSATGSNSQTSFLWHKPSITGVVPTNATQGGGRNATSAASVELFLYWTDGEWTCSELSNVNLNGKIPDSKPERFQQGIRGAEDGASIAGVKSLWSTDKGTQVVDGVTMSCYNTSRGSNGDTASCPMVRLDGWPSGHIDANGDWMQMVESGHGSAYETASGRKTVRFTLDGGGVQSRLYLYWIPRGYWVIDADLDPSKFLAYAYDPSLTPPTSAIWTIWKDGKWLRSDGMINVKCRDTIDDGASVRARASAGQRLPAVRTGAAHVTNVTRGRVSSMLMAQIQSAPDNFLVKPATYKSYRHVPCLHLELSGADGLASRCNGVWTRVLEDDDQYSEAYARLYFSAEGTNSTEAKTTKKTPVYWYRLEPDSSILYLYWFGGRWGCTSNYSPVSNNSSGADNTGLMGFIDSGSRDRRPVSALQHSATSKAIIRDSSIRLASDGSVAGTGRWFTEDGYLTTDTTMKCHHPRKGRACPRFQLSGFTAAADALNGLWTQVNDTTSLISGRPHFFRQSGNTPLHLYYDSRGLWVVGEESKAAAAVRLAGGGDVGGKEVRLSYYAYVYSADMTPPSGIWTYFHANRNRAVMEAVTVTCAKNTGSAQTASRTVRSSSRGSIRGSRGSWASARSRGASTIATMAAENATAPRQLAEWITRPYPRGLQTTASLLTGRSRATIRARTSASNNSRGGGGGASRSASSRVGSGRTDGTQTAGIKPPRGPRTAAGRSPTVREAGGRAPETLRGMEVPPVKSRSSRTAAGSVEEVAEGPTGASGDAAVRVGTATNNAEGGGSGSAVISDELEHLLELYERQQQRKGQAIESAAGGGGVGTADEGRAHVPITGPKEQEEDGKDEDLVDQILRLWRLQNNRLAAAAEPSSSSVQAATETSTGQEVTTATDSATGRSSHGTTEDVSDGSEEEEDDPSGLPLYLLVESPLKTVTGIWKLSMTTSGVEATAEDVNGRYHYIKKAEVPTELSELDMRAYLKGKREDLGKYIHMNWDQSDRWVIADGLVVAGNRQLPEWAAYASGQGQGGAPASAMWWEWDGVKQKGRKATMSTFSSIDELQAMFESRQTATPHEEVSLEISHRGKGVEAEDMTRDENAAQTPPGDVKPEEKEKSPTGEQQEQGTNSAEKAGGDRTAGVIPMAALEEAEEEDGRLEVSRLEDDSIENVAKLLQSYIDSAIKRKGESDSSSTTTTTVTAEVTTTTTPRPITTRRKRTTTTMTSNTMSTTTTPPLTSTSTTTSPLPTTTPTSTITTTTTTSTSSTSTTPRRTTSTTTTNMRRTTTGTSKPTSAATTTDRPSTRWSAPTTTSTAMMSTTVASNTTSTATTTAATTLNSRTTLTARNVFETLKGMATSTDGLTPPPPVPAQTSPAAEQEGASKSLPSVLFIFGGIGKVGRQLNGVYVRTGSHSGRPVYSLVPLPEPPLSSSSSSSSDQEEEPAPQLDLYYLDRFGVWAIGHRDGDWEDAVVAFVSSVADTPVNVRGSAMHYLYAEDGEKEEEEEGREWTVWNGNGRRENQQILVSAVSALYYPELLEFLSKDGLPQQKPPVTDSSAIE
eukprot:GHVS01016030.1.p1 GENE.GHVS01016030.1~~GHVS01016030.1.p1  ORF type:complete len:2092 (+),score=385.74 GHVS01016030.1:589-6864(+)